MAKKESKRKNLHYRRADFLSDNGLTLQQVLQQAIAKKHKVGERFEILSAGHPDDSLCRFINTHVSSRGMFFGNMILYEKGTNRHTIAGDEDADMLTVEQIAPPDTGDGKRREFLESIFYFGALDNHLVVLQSQALRSRDLENHFNWLLRSSSIIGTDNAVAINRAVSSVTARKLVAHPVTKVRIGTPLIESTEPVEPAGAGRKRRMQLHARGKGLEIIKILAGDKTDRINFDDIMQGSNLEVFVEISYKRKTDDRSQNIINHVTRALRHIDPDDIQIELHNAGKIKGSDLDIQSPVSVTVYNGLVDPEDLFAKMHDWLREKIESGLVEP